MYVCRESVADPDFELRRGPGYILLAQPAFLPSVTSSCFTQNKEGARVPGPSRRSATGGDSHIKETGMLVRNFKTNPTEVSRSCFVVEARNVFHP